MPKRDVSEQRRSDIIQAAAQVFNTTGLHQARMDDVAAAAGISKGTIYLYFPSKDSLIEALLHRLFEPLDAALASLAASDGPIRDQLLNYAIETLHTFAAVRPIHPLILELFALSRRQPTAERVFTAYFVRYREELTAILAAAQRAGSVNLHAFSDDAGQAALAFMAALEGILLLVMINPDLLTADQDGLHIMRAWVDGVCP